MLKGIVAQSIGDKEAKLATPAISLLVEGAIVTAVMQQSSKPADVARNAALALVSNKSRKNK